MVVTKEELLALLDKHVDGVRHYLHLQIGKPLSKDLISAPEIALDNLHRELSEAISAAGAEVPPMMKGAVYQLDGCPAEYLGLDTYHGETTHHFRCDRRSVYVKPERLAARLTP